MTDKITKFLKEMELQNASRGTWGIGTMAARAGAKAGLALIPISVKSTQDHFMISANREVVLPTIAETLKKISLEFKDPALFDIPTATFAIFVGRPILGRMSTPCLVFITLRAVSENSTHGLIEGYAREAFINRTTSSWVKQVRNAICANFP